MERRQLECDVILNAEVKVRHQPSQTLSAYLRAYINDFNNNEQDMSRGLLVSCSPNLDLS